MPPPKPYYSRSLGSPKYNQLKKKLTTNDHAGFTMMVYECDPKQSHKDLKYIIKKLESWYSLQQSICIAGIYTQALQKANKEKISKECKVGRFSVPGIWHSIHCTPAMLHQEMMIEWNILLQWTSPWSTTIQRTPVTECHLYKHNLVKQRHWYSIIILSRGTKWNHFL